VVMKWRTKATGASSPCQPKLPSSSPSVSPASRTRGG
jgi:hypothetical protein